MVGGCLAGQVVPALLTAVHDQPVGHAVAVEARVAADLVGDVLKTDLVPNLRRKGARGEESQGLVGAAMRSPWGNPLNVAFCLNPTTAVSSI